MLHSKLSRIGLLITLLGFAVLGASLYTWSNTGFNHRLYYTTEEHEWVRADSSSEPAVETDEIWRVSADCTRPYYVQAVDQAKAKLKAHNDTIPDEIRAWYSRPARRSNLSPLTDNADSFERSRRAHEESMREHEETMYDLKLQSKYSDWFFTQWKLEQEVQNWEQRLSSVSDQRTTLSEARRRSLPNGAQSAFGLYYFSTEQAKAITAACVTVIPIKMIVTERTNHTDLWRWPVDHVLPFWGGIALLFVGLLLSPAARWIGAGR